MFNYIFERRLNIRNLLVFMSVFLPWKKAEAGTLRTNFNVSGFISAMPSWYDNGILANRPGNSPNFTVIFTFGRGELAIPDSSGNLTTDARNETISNPGGLLAIKSILVTLPSSCTIGSSSTTDGVHPVDTSMSLIVAGNAPHQPASSGQALPLTQTEVNRLVYTQSSAPTAATGAQIYLNLANINVSSGSTGAITCGSPGNFSVSF